MARQANIKIENNFVNGLITESTALSFPENAATDTLNCVFDKTGRVSRRLGMDVEAASSLTGVTKTTSEFVSEFLWETVGGVAETSFFVVQQANTIRFYDVSSSTDITSNVKGFSIDLDGFVPNVTTPKDPAIFQCQFASGNGSLFVTNPACEPFYVDYDADADAIVFLAITMEYRDLSGLLDGLEGSERPSGTEANLFSGNPNHYYNIVNQGWFENPLDQWDSARTDMPSNTDVVALYRNSVTDAFINTRVDARTNKSTSPAPRGHFILNVFTPDRIGALASDGLGTLATVVTGVKISSSTGVFDGMEDFVASQAKAWDNDTTRATASNSARKTGSPTTAYMGKNFFSSGKRTIHSVIVYGSTDAGFISGADPTVNMDLRASNTLPTDFAADGASLGTATPTDSNGLTTTISSSDTTTPFQFVWVYFNWSGANTFNLGEMEIYTPIPDSAESLDADEMETAERPTSVAFLAQRVWYAGINDSRRGSNIYYSQLIENQDQYGKCHQSNDPTSEDFFDILATDGGVIKIPEMGGVVKLFAYQSSILVLATNGIWLVSGTSGAGFIATDFQVKKISSVGCKSPYSVTDVAGVPSFWGDGGIYTVSYDFENDSFQVKSISDEKIKSFIEEIPEYNKQWVKSAYSPIDKRVFWLYNDSATLSSTDNFEYTKILVLDAQTGAFYPWTPGDNSDIDIRGVSFIQSGDRTAAALMKYTITQAVDASNENLGYAELSNTTYLDWAQHAIDEDDITKQIDYTSFFETAHYVHGQGVMSFQPAYVMVFMDVEDFASTKMQGQFDFSSSGDSGQYSTLQQCYNDLGNTNLGFRSISMKKMKVRGQGRALRLRFESETEKPFTIIGWSVLETINQST